MAKRIKSGACRVQEKKGYGDMEGGLSKMGCGETIYVLFERK